MATLVKILPDARTWEMEAAAEITRCAAEAAAARGVAFVAVSGGKTPLPVFRRLTKSPWREKFPWEATHWFWVDERWVPPTDAESNYGLAWEAMLSKEPVDPCKVHRIETEGLTPDESAAAYEKVLRSVIGKNHLDLALLGMGSDGHTGSLFANTPALAENERWVAATEAPDGVRQRITMTLPLLNGATTVLFLVAGAQKQAALNAVLHGKSPDMPARKVRAAKRTVWLVDSKSADVDLPR